MSSKFPKATDFSGVLLRLLVVVSFAITFRAWPSFANAQVEAPATVPPPESDATVARALKVGKLSESTNAVKLTWIPSPAGGEQILARASVPIETLAILLASESVAIFNADVSEAVDRGLAPGVYYYAIVPRKQIQQRTAVFLKGENYTLNGVEFHAAATTAPAAEVTPPPVSLLLASVVSKGAIQATWRGLPDENVVYTVYRSSEPIHSPDALERAQRLVIIRNSAQLYLDKNVGTEGSWYYAVTTRYGNGSENSRLVLEQNTTRDPIVLSKTDYTGVPGFIVESKVAADAVEVRWKKVTAIVKGYHVYRANTAITKPEDLNSAKIVATVDAGRDRIRDSGLAAGTYYYAVIAVGTSGQEIRKIVINRNTLPAGVTLEGAKILAGPHVYGLEAYVIADADKTKSASDDDDSSDSDDSEQSDAVASNNNSDEDDDFGDGQENSVPGRAMLTWKVRGRVTNAMKVILFASSNPITGTAALDGAIELGQAKAKRRSFVAPLPNIKGSYYAAVLVGPEGERLLEFIANETYTQQALFPIKHTVAEVVEAPVANLNTIGVEKINGILALRIPKGEWKAARLELEKLLASGLLDETARLKAGFFVGVCLLKEDQAEKALKALMRPGIRQAYGSRWDFWYAKTLEKLK